MTGIPKAKAGKKINFLNVFQLEKADKIPAAPMLSRKMPRRRLTGSLNTKRAAFESRILLFKLMTNNVDLLRKRMEE